MRRITSRAVSAFIAAKIERHGKAILPGLGTLKLVTRAAKRVRHPATGDFYQIPERADLAFRLAKPRKSRG